MIEAIEQRRSIRANEDRPVSRELLEEILRAGTLAPSSKNRQPWRFVVVTGQAKAEMLAVMKAGLEREKTAPARCCRTAGSIWPGRNGPGRSWERPRR